MSTTTDLRTATRPPPRRPDPGSRWVDGARALAHLDELVTRSGGDPLTRPGRAARELVVTALKLVSDRADSGQMKLLSASLKEMRHAYRVFAPYAAAPKVSIFGSARTPPDHPDYVAAVRFSRLMAEHGWLVITGAGEGIMKAGHEGPGADASFGLSIRLPFETTANSVIAGDHKLIRFRYFFTRKLMFLSHSQAVAAFPGGFGTQDELMESLTLMQTGRSAIVPIVLLEGPGGEYWRGWERYVSGALLAGGFISPEDTALFHLAAGPEDAVAHVTRFYANYHSSRYVGGDDLMIRTLNRLTDDQLAALDDEFAPLVRTGRILRCDAHPFDAERRDLPRILFTHTRRAFGLVRRLIDRINDFAPQAGGAGVQRPAVTSG